MRSPLMQAVCISVSIALLPAASLRAQDKTSVPTYRAGLKSIAIPAPTTDFAEIGPDYRVLLEPLAPDSNRLIAAFTLPDDAATMRSGGAYSLKQYALVEVLRRAEFATVAPDLFKQVEDAMATQFGADLNASLKDQQDELNHRLKALNGDSAATVSLDKPVLLGVLFSKPDACGFGVIMPVSAKGTTIKMAAGIVVMRVQQRLVYAYIYTEYKDEASVQWVRKTAETWADAILAAN